MRPLAIVTVLWRICMSATLRKLRAWIADWACPELFGALPGKGIMEVHERFYEAVSKAKQSRTDLVGCKADVRKCFDSVCPMTAIQVWRRFGALQQFVICLLTFTANSVGALLGRVLFTLTRFLLGVVCCKAVQPALLCSMH